MANLRSRILIVDDHADIREPLSDYLGRFEFDVTAAEDGVQLRALLAEQTYALIVLDVMLPGENGLSLCRYVTEHHHIPVILLTAITEQADRIAGLEVGADDYVVKPFDPRELVARIRSVLRRTQTQECGNAATQMRRPLSLEKLFLFDGWVLDTRKRSLQDPRGTGLTLSTAEFHLLLAFVENANRVLSRDQLLDLTQRAEHVLFDRSIDSLISRLRKKLEVNTRHPSLLKTVRGDGYLFAAKVTVRQA